MLMVNIGENFIREGEDHIPPTGDRMEELVKDCRTAIDFSFDEGVDEGNKQKMLYVLKEHENLRDFAALEKLKNELQANIQANYRM